MPLSPSTIDDIKAEIASLRELETKIKARVQALEAILVPLGGSREIAYPATGIVPPLPKGNRFASTGLRGAIIATLRERGIGMRAPDIAAILEREGFPNDSSTPLGTRVYNDLWRLAQKGGVKSEMGVFTLVK